MSINYRIKDTNKYLMIGTAMMFDAISIILALAGIGLAPFVNFIIITLPAWGIFLLWFWACGVIFVRPNKKKFYNAWALLETIPWLIDLLPWWTIAVWRAVKLSREADREQQPAQPAPPQLTRSFKTVSPPLPRRRVNDLKTVS